jgi:glutathione S-transferase
MPDSEQITVWGIGTPRTMRPHWMLCELGLDYRTREILPRSESMRDPEFLRRGERGKVPVFERGDLRIGESGAIVFHLADLHREGIALAPDPGTAERAIFDDLCLFALTELDAPLYIIRRHAGLPEIYGESEVAVRSAADYFLRQVAEVDRRLQDDRPFIMGETFSGADILISTCLAWARGVEIPLSDVASSYQGRTQDREGYRKAVEKNFPPAARALLAANRGGASRS